MEGRLPSSDVSVPSGVRFDELTDDELTADFRIFQRRRGHRYSIDDVATAFEAVHAAADPRRILDLGCGIGSVALMLSWRFPRARVLGIEAQAISHTLARWNIARNGLGSRVRVALGDFRDDVISADGPFDVVTGTPPYFPVATATASPDPQRAFARIEYRGGVEAYLEAASRFVAEDGCVVLCAAASAEERTVMAATSVGLCAARVVHVSPREGRAPLFLVFTLRVGHAAEPPIAERWAARDRDGRRTQAYRAIRRTFGFVRLDRRAPGK